MELETPFGVVTCFYHRRCFQARSATDHLGDAFRFGVYFLRSLDRRRTPTRSRRARRVRGRDVWSAGPHA
jgi:hypothetical protein